MYHLILASARKIRHTEYIMKPADPTSDSLISGFNTNIQNAPPQGVANNTSQGIGIEPQLPQNPNPTTSSVVPSTPPTEDLGYTSQPQITPSVEQPEPLLTQQATISPQPLAENSAFAPAGIQLPQNPSAPANTAPLNDPAQIFNPAAVENPIPDNNSPSQMTSPNDPPPAPPSQPQMNQVQPDLTSAVVSEKPKGKTPVLLIILLLLVVGVLGTVGYLAYQNYTLSKNVSDTPPTQASLTVPEVKEEEIVDPYLNYVSHQSAIMPLTFMYPKGWIVNETENEELANQKMIKVNSADFSYEASDIAKGFDLRIGPVNDLTKKYDTFEAFAAEENTDSLFTQESINEHMWLVKGNEAKTLINKSPLTIALYASQENAQEAVNIFRNILNTINISETPPPVPQ